MNFNRKKFELDFHGRPLSLEVSRLAEQATASVLGRYGDTTVLATVVMGNKDESSDYFPLVVDYEERFYAAGKIMGSRFMRREGRPSEEAILTGRIVDRTIRPLFDHRIRRKVQLIITVLEIDNENDPDFVALLTASAALAISEIPWNGPVAAVKLFHDGQKLTINPTNTDVSAKWPADNGFISLVAGTADRINMIELEGIDAQEDVVTTAYESAQKEIAKLIDWMGGIVKEIGQPKVEIKFPETDPKLAKTVKDFLHDGDRLEKAMYVKDKMEQTAKLAGLKESLAKHLADQEYDASAMTDTEHIFETELDELVHRKLLTADQRPDGRKLDEVRDLYGEVGLLKRAHGSAIFVRGNTQALVVTTIAPPGSEQLIETLKFSGKRSFMLHYNFPPYSVGETGRMGSPGRREIGHGALAEKAVHNVMPTKEEFPYTIRVVSEIMSSNGSSSMATVCGTILSLMDAGVPIKKPVAGIAMGMMTGKAGEYKVLTDIQGPEDHYGDMDFKVAGSTDGVRAIQMDVKIDGVNNKMLIDGLAQAKKARLEILKVMNSVIAGPRKELSPYAPVVLSMKIHPSKIGDVIGPGGKIINSIIEKTGALTIDIEQTGEVFIAGPNKDSAQAAYDEVAGIVKEYEVGDIVEGKVVKVLEFGAIVEFGPGRDGMIHVSELKNGYVQKVEDVVKLGDSVKAKVVKIERGKIGLSLKALDKPDK